MKRVGRKIQRTVILLCVFCLSRGIIVWAVPEESPKTFSFYEDGDAVRDE